MANPDLEIRIKAKDDGFGSTIRKAKDDLSGLKSTVDSIASTLTNGVLGGGIVAFVAALYSGIEKLARQTRELKKAADDLNVSPSDVKLLNRFETATGLQGGFTSATQAARVARSDALAGMQDAMDAFTNIGLSLEQIQKLKPDELFFAIARSFESFDINAPGGREKFFAGARLLGGQASAQNLIPYFSGGLLNELRLAGESGAIFAGAIGGDPSALSRYKNDFEPPSAFGYDQQRRIARLAAENKTKEIEIARSQLPIEKQINEVVAERLELQRKLEDVKSPLEKQLTIARILDLKSEQMQLLARIGKLSQSAAQSDPLQRNLSDLYRAGIFTGGAPLQLDMQKQLVDEARKHTDSLKRIDEKI